MIVVVEGISAAGKSTYARSLGAATWVPEFAEQGTPPGPDRPAQERAAYWIAHNERRFARALEVEAEHGYAICDTDPFKSHYDWCMARAGFASMDIFEAAMPMARESFAAGRLGYADLYMVKRIAPEVARRQKEGDPTRTRRRFDMHLALQPHLMAWFEALAQVLPGRVEFAFRDQTALLNALETNAVEANPRRFDVSALDSLFELLPNGSP
ncbi:MAG: hypothetical protein AAF251_17730 [Pseudomonadota bacterium]